MNLLDLHFRGGKRQTVENVDHCKCGDGYLTGYKPEGRLILRVLLTSIDWFEARSESLSLSGRGEGEGHYSGGLLSPAAQKILNRAAN